MDDLLEMGDIIMAKRIAVFLLIISMITCAFSSCAEININIPQIGGGVTNNGFGFVPVYTENYTYLPIIECNGKEYRIDELSEIKEGHYEHYEEDPIMSFGSLDHCYRGYENALIAVGTVIDNPVQTKMFEEGESGEILCPFRIDDILYQAEKSPALEGEVIEIRAKNMYIIFEDYFGEVKGTVWKNGAPFISGARYLLYLKYSEIQPDYLYKRYDVSTDGKFEITDYSSRFSFKSSNAKESDWRTVALRYYGLHNESVFTHDTEKYPLSESLASTDEVKTAGLKIGDTVVQGLEYTSGSFTCTGYSQKDKKYTFEYNKDQFGGYDITNGTVPEGCPIIKCEVGDEIEIISPIYSIFGDPGVLGVTDADLYDTSGNEVGAYLPDKKNIIYGYEEVAAPGVYWLYVEVKTWFAPSNAEFAEPPEVGEEFISETGYLFCIIMD